MLLLNRRKKESIMVGDDVEIIVVDINHNKVRLGINAPKYIPVHRKEVYNAIEYRKRHKKPAV